MDGATGRFDTPARACVDPKALLAEAAACVVATRRALGERVLVDCARGSEALPWPQLETRLALWHPTRRRGPAS